MFPYDWPKNQLAEGLAANELEQVLHNLPAGDWAAGERGIACLPGREGEFQDGVGMAIEYARTLKCPTLNCLVGLTPRENAPDEGPSRYWWTTSNFAAMTLAEEGIRLLVEALNDQDIPDFHLVSSQSALDLLEDVDHPNLRLQYDIYHMQKMEGNLIATIDTQMARIGHIQLADNPGRHEPGTGEINFPNLFRAIDAAGYDSWIGCEYIPAGTTEEGLGWFSAYQN